MINGRLSAGRKHHLILSADKLDRTYRMVNGVYFDVNLLDVNPLIADILFDFGVRFVSVLRNNRIEGRSWEMSAVCSILGLNGAFSGTVVSKEKDMITFGLVPGLRTKRTLVDNLISSNELPYIAISR
jgi:hypothetical protein